MITIVEGGTLGPLGFLTGVVLGTSVAISAVLLMVMAVFVLSGVPQASLGAEPGSLLVTVALFAALAAISGLAFYGLQKQRPWRWSAQLGTWALILCISWYYWPASAG